MPYVNFARTTGLVGLAAALFLAGAVMTEAQAGNGGRQKAHAGQGAGSSWSRSSTVQRTPSGHTRQDKWQSQDGRSASRQVDVTHDPASGTRNRAAAWTGPEGRTTTRNTTIANDRAAGSRSVDSTTTGFDGRTTVYSSDAQRTNDGYVRDVIRTLPDGQVNQRSIDVSCDPAGQSCARTVVGGNGG